MGMESDDYLAKQKLKTAPGAKSGTLAADMGNQGPAYRRTASSGDLGVNMKMPGDHGGKMRRPVTAKLRELMNQ